jgi:hypothetical protein
MLSVSRDGGHTFGSWSEHDMGEEGDFMKRIVRRRIGVARHLVLRIRISSPVKTDLIAASAVIGVNES